MRKISIIIIVCMLITLLTPFNVLAETKSQTKIAINGDYVEFNDDTGYPFVDANNRTQVPFRVTLEKFGAIVSWDNEKRAAVAEKDGIKVEVPIGQEYILKNGEKVENDTAALIKDGRTYLPIRIVMETFGSKVGWNGETKTVEITSNIIDLKSNIVSLTENNVEFSVIVNEAKEETLSDLYAVLTSEGETAEKPINKIGQNNIAFESLKSDTEYSFEVYNKDNNTVLEIINFRTFAGKEDVELHYFIDAREGKTEEVDVTIFGNYKNTSSFILEHQWYHVEKDAIRIVDNSLNVVLDGNYEFDNNELLLNMKFSNKNGNFKVSYKSDKSFYGLVKNGIDEDVSFGTYTDKYLLVTGEQFLLSPSHEYDTEGTMISMVLPKGWKSKVGYEKTDLDNLYRIDDRKFDMPGTNFHAYDINKFTVTEKNIYETDIVVAVEKGIEFDYANEFFAVYEKLCELWGDSVNKGEYSLVVFKDNRDVNVGEYDRGQAVPSAHSMTTITHQVYHVWNGWAYRVPWEEEKYNDGLWVEGFNEYYVYKILESLDNRDGLEHMKGRYNDYRNNVKHGNDVPMLEEGSAVYEKGAVIAYALDKEIVARSQGQYSLDDVVKYIWNDWIENGEGGSYDKMIDYINSIIPEGIDDWWQEYVVNNQEIILEEFE